jgi:hypothetical protein
MAFNRLPKVEAPDAKGDPEPQRQQRKGGEERGRFEADKDPACGEGVGGESDGTGDHGAGFDSGVEGAFMGDSETECGEGDGGRGSEEAREAFGAKDVADDGEEADNGAANKEAEEKVGHGAELLIGWQVIGGSCQAAFSACLMRRRAAAASLQPSSLYCLPSSLW